jgi:predicted ATP-grasp superfamily ATP-dependent carboligase
MGPAKMVNLIIVGMNMRLVVQVLLAIRSYSDAKCVVLGGADTSALRWSSLCTKYMRIGVTESEDDAYIAAIERFSTNMPDTVLIPVDCEAERITNRVRLRLHIRIIPIPDTAILDILDDKWRFYQFCKEHGFRVPETLYIGDKRNMNFDAVAAVLGIPFIIKPVSESGSFGVHIVHSHMYYEAEIRNNKSYRFKSLIAQKYIDGIDMGLDLFSIQGKVSAFAVQQRHVGGVRFLSDVYLEKIVHEFCAACNYDGVMNIDVRREESTGAAYLIEANPRFWVTHSAAVWNGMNFVAECIAQTSRPGCARKLTAGEFHDRRHPLFWPSWWRPLLSDPGERGRILRAMMFDLYLLSSFAISLPIRIWRYAVRLVSPDSASRPSI